MMVTAKEMGAKGGSARSEAKTLAARKNARKNAGKPRSKWITWAHYEVLGADGNLHQGHLVWLKKFDDTRDSGADLHAAIDADLRRHGQAKATPFRDLRHYGSTSCKLDGWRLPSIAECFAKP